MIDAMIFSVRIDRAFSLMVKRNFEDAYKVLDKINIPGKKIWYYELLCGECLMELGRSSSAFEHFSNIITITNSNEFTPQERYHILLYLYKKYGYETKDEDYINNTSSGINNVSSVRDRIKRYMPLNSE